MWFSTINRSLGAEAFDHHSRHSAKSSGLKFESHFESHGLDSYRRIRACG
jgi:hypothetical protein